MTKLKLILLKYKWHLIATLGILFLAVTYILFINDKKTVEEVKDLLLTAALEKKSDIVTEMIEVKKNDVEGLSQQVADIEESIRELKSKETAAFSAFEKMNSLRELSDAFKNM